MKTNAKKVQVFQVRLWTQEAQGFIGGNSKNKAKVITFNGMVKDVKSKEKPIHFKTAGKFITAIEGLYLKAERKR
jgi:hypothetical protein